MLTAAEIEEWEMDNTAVAGAVEHMNSLLERAVKAEQQRDELLREREGFVLGQNLLLGDAVDDAIKCREQRDELLLVVLATANAEPWQLQDAQGLALAAIAKIEGASND